MPLNASSSNPETEQTHPLNQELLKVFSSGGSHDPRIPHFFHCQQNLSNLPTRAVRDGMASGLNTYLELLLEEYGSAESKVEINDIIHLDEQAANSALKMCQDARSKIAALDDAQRTDITHDKTLIIFSLDLIELHLLDHDLIHLTSFLERISDLERGWRRLKLLAQQVSLDIPFPTDTVITFLCRLLNESAETALLKDKPSKVAWRAWRAAGKGENRAERASELAARRFSVKIPVATFNAIATSRPD